jgi:hypothetical protein
MLNMRTIVCPAGLAFQILLADADLLMLKPKINLRNHHSIN